MQLDFDAAFDFYQKHINRSDFFQLLKERNLKTSGSVPSIAWELFGSILTGKKEKSGYGADLEGVEIKSAITGSSFEYQYHLNTGLEKLREDQVVDHFFCSYSADYQSFNVFFATGTMLSPFFSKWIPEYLSNYNKMAVSASLDIATELDTAAGLDSSKRRQRFRRSIPYGWVMNNSNLLMTVNDGKLSSKIC
jgi:hypothetical protein